MKKQIQNSNQLAVLANGLHYWRIKREDEIKTQLQEKIAQVRRFRRAYREGSYDYLNSYPCGYQDAFGDKVEALYREFEALKLAYRLTKGDGEHLFRLVSRMNGGDL